jgi:pSer/pThr/pTyr-binding forkhead associated (FHA) protein
MSKDAKRTTTTADGISISAATASFGHIGTSDTPAKPAPADGPPREQSELKVTLEVGGMDPVRRTFAPGEILVGRRPSNDLVIDGEGLKVVSGFHLRFAFESGRWCLEDKNSTNGTYINGLRTKGLQAVREGDVVELGRPRKKGTYRAVKLTLGLTGSAAAQATADFLPPKEAKKVTDVPVKPPVPEAPPTLVAMPGKEAGAGTRNGSGKGPSKGPSKQPSHGPQGAPRTVANGITANGTQPATKPETKPKAKPAPKTVAAAPPKSAPAPAPPRKVPAVHPSGIRELIGQVQEKSRRLGEVSYRLDAYVDDLASASVERHVALGITDVPGGTAVIDLIAKEERLNATLQSLETELPNVRTRLEDELTPLEHTAAEKKKASDQAALQFKRSAKRRDEGLAALKAAFSGATAALRTTLAPVVDITDEKRAAELSASPAASLDPATGEPVWKYWSVALQSGLEEIQSREEELGAIRAEAADADDLAKTAEAEAQDAEADWEEARKEADDRRIAIEASVTEKEAIFARTTSEIATVRDSMGATAKEFILSLLAAPESASGSLGSLAGMKDARQLFQEVEVLRQELADLESGAY